MARKITIEILILLLSILFLYAGISKLLDVHLFSSRLSRSPWIGKYHNMLAWSIPAFEVSVAAFLLVGGRLRIIALRAYAVSLLIFSIYISVVLFSGEKAPCTCGGLIQKLSWPEHVVLNLTFMLLSILAIRLINVTNSHLRNWNQSENIAQSGLAEHL